MQPCLRLFNVVLKRAVKLSTVLSSTEHEVLSWINAFSVYGYTHCSAEVAAASIE